MQCDGKVTIPVDRFDGGGPKRNRLFMKASHSHYALYVNTQGVRGG